MIMQVFSVKLMTTCEITPVLRFFMMHGIFSIIPFFSRVYPMSYDMYGFADCLTLDNISELNLTAYAHTPEGGGVTKIIFSFTFLELT